MLSGVKDIREAVERAPSTTLQQSGRHTILFVDEVHRFNKAQQDAFLPFVERGLITFIGATTENPSFEVNSALLSRAAVYVLQAARRRRARRCCSSARAGDALRRLRLERRRATALIGYADGDARRLLNMLEQLAIAAAARSVAERRRRRSCSDALAQSLRRFDKGGEQFYDQISALHKSVRGSDPDAALYWLARMLDGGADPLYVGAAPRAHGDARTSAWPIRARCAWRSMPARPTSAWARPKASSRWPRR